MIRSAYKACLVFNFMLSTMTDLIDYKISDSDWEVSATICKFLESAAVATEAQSGVSYVTLSMSTKLCSRLQGLCKNVIDNNDVILKPVAEAMIAKLDKYSQYVRSDLSALARILDPRFSNDILADNDVLLRHVQLTVDVNDQQGDNSVTISGSECRRPIINDIMDENSVGFNEHDEVNRYLRHTSVGDKKASPLTWWKLNAGGFPNISHIALDLLSVQASSVASESAFSTAGTIVDPYLCSLSDSTISSCILLKSWNRRIPFFE